MRITQWPQWFKIDWIYINETIFQDELSDYEIRDREDLIDSLITRISEWSKDKDIMKSDLKLLMNMDEELILSCISTNDYADSKTDWYYMICDNILELNKQLWL